MKSSENSLLSRGFIKESEIIINWNISKDNILEQIVKYIIAIWKKWYNF